MRRFLDLYRKMRAHTASHDDRTQWAFFKVFWIYNDDGTPYLKRWRIFQCPAFGFYLHHIVTVDQRDLHDHPYPFASLILKGGYVEAYAESTGTVLTSFLNQPDAAVLTQIGSVVEYRQHNPGTFNVIHERSAHRILSHHDGDTWSLMFVGPRVQKWGFWTKEGFVPWDEYEDKAIETNDHRTRPGKTEA